MLGTELDGSGISQQLIGSCRTHRKDAGDPQLPLRQRAGLVERDHAHGCQPLEACPSTPLRAAGDSADTIETGVEMTSAHGQEITRRTSAR